MRRRVAALAAMLAISGVVAMAGGAPAGAETRDPGFWPFAASSPWNTPLGTGARYGDETCDAAVRAEAGNSLPPWINAERYGLPLFWAAGDDPLKTVYKSLTPVVPLPTGESQGRYRIPNDASPDRGKDRSLIVIEPGGLSSVELLGAYNRLLWVNTALFARHDLVAGDGFGAVKGSGPRAGGASFLGGLMRKWELDAGIVRHALALTLTQQRMSPTHVPPASGIDFNHHGYSGPIPMGQLVALPPDVPVDSLGLTSRTGRLVAEALRTYGAYVVDTGNALALYAEPGAKGHVEPARTLDEAGESDMKRIVSRLRCVSNNEAGAWGGGGTPLAAPAPPIE